MTRTISLRKTVATEVSFTLQTSFQPRAVRVALAGDGDDHYTVNQGLHPGGGGELACSAEKGVGDPNILAPVARPPVAAPSIHD